MRGRVVVLLLSLLVVVGEASPQQCSVTRLFSAPYRKSFLDVAVSGNDLWAATSYGIELYGRQTDPPSFVAGVAVPGVTRVVRVQNNVAYAASGTSIYTIRANGRSLEIAGSVDTGAIVNDLALTTTTLFAATGGNGLLQYDLLDPLHPAKMPVTLATSTPNVLSLALTSSTLYAADGDSTVEIFSTAVPSLTQKVGTVASLPRSLAVKAGGSKVFVSDGQQTDVFAATGSNLQRATTTPAPFGTTAFGLLTNEVVFAAGNDRRLHAYDFTTVGTPVELYENDLAPSAGTVNRILALQVAQGRVYAAAGDLGLLTFDARSFTAPFPVRAYTSTSMTSVVSLGNKLYVTPSSGGITEYLQSTNGSLTLARHWDASGDTVHDGNQNQFLVSSSGATVTYWSLIGSTPSAISRVTFAKAVTSAVLVGNTVYAVLSDRSLASADMSLLTPVAAPIALNAKPSFIARSGNAIAIADVQSDSTTQLLFYSTPDFTKPPQLATIEGEATSRIALGGRIAAVSTFRGISIVDFATGTTPVVLTGSTSEFARDLAIAGTSLVELTDRALLVFDLTARKLTRTLPLPSDAVAVHVSQDSQTDLADVATLDGVTSVAFRAASSTPVLLPGGTGNTYYRKVAATADHLFLFDARGVDIYTTFSTAPRFVAGIRTSGLVDVAVSSTTLFTLSGNGTVSAYSLDGALLTQNTLSEGEGVQPLAIAAVNGAPWVSIAKGCLSGGCLKQTIVLEPQSLVKTAALTGSTTDVTSNGTRAYALFELPNEVRVIDTTDPLHPSVVASRASEGPAPSSIAVAGSTVFVTGDKVYTYAAADLAKTTELGGSWSADPSGALAFVDQRVRAVGDCALVTGRTFAAQPYGGTANTLPTLPAAAKSVATQPNRFLVLTDYSLEIWTTGPFTPAVPRRKAAR